MFRANATDGCFPAAIALKAAVKFCLVPPSCPLTPPILPSAYVSVLFDFQLRGLFICLALFRPSSVDFRPNRLCSGSCPSVAVEPASDSRPNRLCSGSCPSVAVEPSSVFRPLTSTARGKQCVSCCCLYGLVCTEPKGAPWGGSEGMCQSPDVGFLVFGPLPPRGRTKGQCSRSSCRGREPTFTSPSLLVSVGPSQALHEKGCLLGFGACSDAFLGL